MANDIQIFNFHGSGVRVVEINNEPHWVASDVAKILGYGSAKDLTRRLDDDEKGRRSVPTLGGKQQLNIITESGLYSAILRSKRPVAKTFKRWVTHEVLPLIRKHGAYMTPEGLK